MAAAQEILNDDDDGDEVIGEAAQALAAYMESGSAPPASWRRQPCCESSRYLYCPECCRLLVPKEEWPDPIQEGSLQLPFNLHILLDDKRASSTGVQLVSILQAALTGKADSADNDKGKMSEEEPTPKVKLYDLTKNEMPPYSELHPGHDDQEGTYLLFPGVDSVPLSSVLKDENTTIKTLVVLDCRWARTSGRLDPFIASLPKISLDHPPSKSYYWRWHNTGVGMLSTVEAIYFAAWQITTSCTGRGWTLEERQERLVHLLFLFRLQRAVIQSKWTQKQVRSSNPHAPFTEEAKAFARELRHKGKKKYLEEQGCRSSLTSAVVD